MFRKYLFTLLLLAVPVVAFGQVSDDGKPVKPIDSLDIVDEITVWHEDTVYLMTTRIYIDSGRILIIEPGTIIKADNDQGQDAAALIIARGGKIYAEGTRQKPIIFTSEFDDLDDPNDIDFGANGRGLWGGVIILGYAGINVAGGVNQIEGINPSNTKGRYGADYAAGEVPIDDENSGIMRYVSIRHGGAEIGSGNEINGLTMGGVGSGTTIEYIEVWHNKDDGFECFGGTVNLKYIASCYVGDDNLDYDEGWRGNAQYVFAIADPDGGDHGGEHDGGTAPEDGIPYAKPVVYNATYIGSGVGTANAQNMMILRDNAGGIYRNSIFTEHNGLGLTVEDVDADTGSVFADSERNTRVKHSGFVYNPGLPGYEWIDSCWDCNVSSPLPGWVCCPGTPGLANINNIHFEDNIWWDFPNTWQDPSLGASAIPQQFVWNRLMDPALGLDNDNVDPQLNNTTRGLAGVLDPRPSPGGPAGSAPAPVDPGFEDAGFKGAFDPNATPWVAHWTALDFCGALADFLEPSCECITDDGKPVIPVSGVLTGFHIWTADNVYLLTDRTYVGDGNTQTEGVLLIEPGTVIKGDADQGELAAALIVTRFGKIYALGACDCPVVFTSEFDDVDDPNDIEFGVNGRGLWGGVIILGKDTINTAQGWGSIEGIVATDPNGRYGNVDLGIPADPNDNSGVFRYVSIRHGGTEIGSANEINGLTLGAVGSGTSVHHVEVWHNADDGFEMFGGSVNLRYVVGAYVDDDNIDYDEGWDGKAQFILSVADGNAGDHGGEHDGGTTPEDGLPYATPDIANATYIGSGVGSPNTQNGFILRDNAGGYYYNSIFTQHNGNAITIEDVGADPTQDSERRLREGDLDFQCNLWWDFVNPVQDPSSGASAVPQQFVWDALFAPAGKFNENLDPGILCVDRDPLDPKLDPRPDPLGPARANICDLSGDPFFLIVDYKGAVDPDLPIDSLWLAKWTWLYCYGILQEGPCGDTSCCNGDGKRGNVDDQSGPGGEVDVADLSYLVDFLFRGGPPPPCTDEGNVDALTGPGGPIDVADLSYLVDFLFRGGPPPPACP